MNPIRKLLIRFKLVAITPDDLADLIHRSQNTSLTWTMRFHALIEYAVLTHTPDRLEQVFNQFAQAVLRKENTCPTRKP